MQIDQIKQDKLFEESNSKLKEKPPVAVDEPEPTFNNDDEQTILRMKAAKPQGQELAKSSLNPELENFPMSSENSDDRKFREALIEQNLRKTEVTSNEVTPKINRKEYLGDAINRQRAGTIPMPNEPNLENLIQNIHI